MLTTFETEVVSTFLDYLEQKNFIFLQKAIETVDYRLL